MPMCTREKRKRNSLAKWPVIFIAPFGISYILFFLYPLFSSFYISLTNWSAMNMMQREFVGFQNYIRVFQDKMFWKSIVNTLRITLWGMPITIICGLLVAVMMYRLTRFRQVIQTINFLPYITMPTAIGMIFANLFAMNTGAINLILEKLGWMTERINWLGSAQFAYIVVIIMFIWKNFGYFMVLYLSGLSTIPNECYEAAKLDGANSRQIFFKITMPLLRPINTFILVQGSIGCLQLFDEARTLILGSGSDVEGGPGRSLMTIIWYFYNVSFKDNSRFGYGAAIAFSLLVIIAAVAFLSLKIMTRKEE